MRSVLNMLIFCLQIKIIIGTDENENMVEDYTEVTTQNNIQFDEEYTKCYGDLGCVSTDSTWFQDDFRPVNLRPLELEIIKTEFILIRKNRTSSKNSIFGEVVTTNKRSIQSSGYTTGKYLFMLIHDFTGTGYTGWVKHMTKSLKKRTKKCNVISVDWHTGAEPPYDQAVANARVVALEIIAMIRFLKENYKLTMEQVHLIGHGVGAHIAGYVGQVMKPNKITALDPVGPRFQGMPPHVRLDPTDGDYVEILHTDAQNIHSQGTMELLGHTDFFINNAENQPGCPPQQSSYDLLSVTRANLNEGQILPGCSHKRAYKYYIEALDSEECTFLGIKCTSYQEFLQGKCTNCGVNCRTFGLVTYKELNNGSYFLQTDSSLPYCMFQYRANVEISGTRSKFYGFFQFILIDKNHFVTRSSTLEPRYFSSGTNNTFVFYTTVPEMSKIIKAKVCWKEKPSILCSLYCKQSIIVEKISIQSINSSGRRLKKIFLCPSTETKEIFSGDFVDFTICKT
ncbi:hypothetical protein ABEB36_008986 [Hypothenemus hampei]|uniref:Lipase domain-containing protein n=1 Tax=Hypothenemus hampei TaxID=57062 RepID=A0ABD1ENQ3_HYPHA